MAQKDNQIAMLEEKYQLLENEFRAAVDAASELFQGKDAPYGHLLKPGQRMLVDGFKALANEIERLNRIIDRRGGL